LNFDYLINLMILKTVQNVNDMGTFGIKIKSYCFYICVKV